MTESHTYRATATVAADVERIRMEREDGMPPAPKMVFKCVVTGEVFRTRSAPQDGWVEVYRGLNGESRQIFDGDRIDLIGDLP